LTSFFSNRVFASNLDSLSEGSQRYLERFSREHISEAIPRNSWEFSDIAVIVRYWVTQLQEPTIKDMVLDHALWQKKHLSNCLDKPSAGKDQVISQGKTPPKTATTIFFFF